MKTKYRVFAALALWTVVVSLFIPGSQPSPAYGGPVQVSVFSFPGLTEGTGACSDEVDNLEEIISQLGYTVDRTITSLADGGTTFLAKLNASQFFFVPDMESAFTVASSDFPDTAVTAFRTWLNAGGVFVMTGTAGAKDVNFINRMTGWSLASASGSSAPRVDANVTGTPFDGAANAVTLGTPSATDSINGSAAPAEANFKPLYGTETQAAVATMNYGSGTIVYLGWDFYNAGYSGVNDYTSAACPANSDDWVQKIVPATLTYASNLSGASPLENISASADPRVPGIFLTVAGPVGRSASEAPVYYGADRVAVTSTYLLTVTRVSKIAPTITTLAEGTIDADGSFSSVTRLPALTPGIYNVQMVGTHLNGSTLQLTSQITIGGVGEFTSIGANIPVIK